MMRTPALLRAKPKRQSAITYSAPAPIGGWNTHDPLAAMPERDAVLLDNFFPTATEVALRPGALEWVSGFASRPLTFLPWNGAGTNKLFAATSTGIYDVTATGVLGSSVQAVTSGDFVSVNFPVAGGHYLVAVNGVDNLLEYTGSAWQTLTDVSTPAITGVDTADLNYVAVIKERLWFVENYSMSAWYLPTKAIAGAAVEFPLGQIFPRGGYLIALGSWTFDGGNGVDDYTVFVSSEGEIAVYKGPDPATAATFSKVGTYYVGEPITKRCLAQYGGDLLYLSRNGLLPLSKLLQSATVNYQQALTNKIDTAFAAATSAYGDNPDWGITAYPTGNLLFVNVPIAANYAHQYVMNTITGAWCRFTGLNASAWCVFDQSLYLATSDKIGKFGITTSDFGAAIVATALPAYTYAGLRGKVKHYKLLRPILTADQKTWIRLGGKVDFRSATDISQTAVADGAASLWDTATWDSGVWAGGKETYLPWASIGVYPGNAFSLLLEVSSSTATMSWIATDYVVEAGGIL